MSRERTNKITIYQVKSVISFESLDFTAKNYSLVFENEKSRLFIQRDKISKPSWASYIEPLIPEPREALYNRKCSFIFIVRNTFTNYIITGGSGFTEIQDYIVEDFGLNLALKMIDEKEIQALNQKSMKGTTRQIIRAVAGYDPLFDRDNYTRILNAIEGKAEFDGKKFRIIGKSSLALRTAKDVNHIDEVLTQVEEVMSLGERIHFPKSYKEVKDESKIDLLEALMLDNFQKYWLGQAERENIYLEFKDPFVQFRCERFIINYKGYKAEISDFDLDLIKSELISKGLQNITAINDLYKILITGLNEDSLPEVKKEPVYNLMIFEGTLDNINYIKFGKQWFQILEEVQNYINEELSYLIISTDILPEWDKTNHPLEINYNDYVAEQKNWECLDQDFVHIQGHSKIELCDLYDKFEKTFYHVKETWGCKSAYLFTQGITAAESYRQSSAFRAKCKEKWPDLFTEEIKKARLVFGIADNKAFADNFPRNMSYFAKLNLYNAVSVLKQYDFDVSLAPIRVSQGNYINDPI